MNIWLCPVKLKSWRIVRKVGLFGVPKVVYNVFSQVRPEDLLIFHVLKPVRGIVAIAKVTSQMFEDDQDIWGRNRYPLRVKIEILQGLPKSEKPAPLSALIGENTNPEIEIEPYLGNVCITKITEEQYEKIKKYFT